MVFKQPLVSNLKPHCFHLDSSLKRSSNITNWLSWIPTQSSLVNSELLFFITIQYTINLKQLLGISWYPSVIKHLRLQMPSLPPTFRTHAAATQIISNWRRGPLKYFQLTPGLSNLVLRLLQGHLKYRLPVFLLQDRWKHRQFHSLNFFLPISMFVCPAHTFILK